MSLHNLLLRGASAPIDMCKVVHRASAGFRNDFIAALVQRTLFFVLRILHRLRGFAMAVKTGRLQGTF